MADFDETGGWKNWVKIGCIAAAVIALIIIIICLINFGMKKYSKSHTKTTIDSTLQKVLAIEELHTYEYSYSSWATVYETKYDMETYRRYNYLSSILTKDKKIIDAGVANLDKSFQDYKESLSKRYVIYQGLINDGVRFEDFANAGYQDSDLFNIAQKAVGTKEPVDIYRYYYYTLLPDRLSILSNCENYDDLCDLEHFLQLNEKNALKTITTIKYIVAYDGKVRTGINDSIKFETDNEGIIQIIVPPVKILSVAVTIPPDQDNKSTIVYRKNSTNRNNFVQEAQQQCENDLYAKINMEQQFLSLAQENLFTTIKSLVDPFMVDKEYVIVPSKEEI